MSTYIYAHAHVEEGVGTIRKGREGVRHDVVYKVDPRSYG